jgi:hypothetical protein
VKSLLISVFVYILPLVIHRMVHICICSETIEIMNDFSVGMSVQCFDKNYRHILIAGEAMHDLN